MFHGGPKDPWVSFRLLKPPVSKWKYFPSHPFRAVPTRNRPGGTSGLSRWRERDRLAGQGPVVPRRKRTRRVVHSFQDARVAHSQYVVFVSLAFICFCFLSSSFWGGGGEGSRETKKVSTPALRSQRNRDAPASRSESLGICTGA